jgi:alanyl-tRNA synthetase
MTSFNPTDLRNRIEKLGDLPTLPHVVQRLAAMIGRPTVSTEEIGSIIEKERELDELKLKMASGAAVASTARTVAGVAVHVQRTDGLDGNGMRALADQLRDKLKSGVIALGAATGGDKVSLLVVVTKDLIGTIKAGEIIKAMATEVGGTGGGRPEMAQAGGKDPAKLDAALEKAFSLVETTLQR